MNKFTKLLDQKGVSYYIENGSIIIDNETYIDFADVTSLPENIQFNNRGGVDLDNIKALAENTRFNNGGNVYLESLTSLPENVQFNNKGAIFLRNLTLLPENVNFNNEGDVYLKSLNNERQIYRGKEITLRTVDSHTMLIKREKTCGDILITKACYFGGGDIAKLEQCYIASRNGFNAHGETIKEAIRDLRFKVAQSDYNSADIIAKIREVEEITFNEFRLITGACFSGLHHGLQELGLPKDTEKLPLKTAMEFVVGKYGHRQMVEAFGDS